MTRAERVVTDALVGVRSGDHTQVIAPAGVRIFLRATDDDNPAYADGAVAPPVYAYVLGAIANFDLYTRIFPEYPAVDVIHLASDMHFHRPLVPGTSLTTFADVVGVQRTPRGGLLHFRNAQHDDAGVLVAEMFLTVLVPLLAGVPDCGEVPPETRIAALRRARALGRRERVIEPNLPLRWSAACGDFQPLHFSDEAARAVGLPRAILHGGCTMALCGAAAVDLAAGGDPARLARLSVRFSQPVFPGSRLVLEVSEPVEVDGMQCHAVRAEADGKPAIRGGRVDVRP